MKRITADTGEGALTALVCDDCLEGFPEEWRKLSEAEAPAASACDVCERSFGELGEVLKEIFDFDPGKLSETRYEEKDLIKFAESVEAELDAPGPVGKPEPIPLQEGPRTVPEPVLRVGLAHEVSEALIRVPSRSEIEKVKAAFGETAERVKFKLAELADGVDEHEHICQKCCFLYKTKDFPIGEHDCPQCGYRQSCSLEAVKRRLTTADLDHGEMESRAPIVWIVGLSLFWLVVFGIVWLVFL